MSCKYLNKSVQETISKQQPSALFLLFWDNSIVSVADNIYTLYNRATYASLWII